MYKSKMLWLLSLSLLVLQVASADISGYELDVHSRFNINGNDGTVYVEYSAFDADENIILVGEVEDDVDFHGDTYSSSKWSGFIAKYDNSEHSNLLWTKFFPGMNDDGYTNCYSVSTADNGDIAVAGFFDGSISFDDSSCEGENSDDRQIYIAYFDADGNEQWTKCFGTSGQDGATNAVTIGNDGYVYATGRFYGLVDFGGGEIGEAGEYSCYIAKYSSSGEYQWSSSYATNGDFWTITVNDNDVAVVGSYTGSFTINDNTTPYVGGAAALVVVLDAATGEYNWHQAFGDDDGCEIYSAEFDINGDLVVGGDAPGAFTIDSTDFDGSGIAFLAKFSSDGTLLWGHQFSDSEDNWSIVTVKIGYENNIFFTGHTEYTGYSLGGEILPYPAGFLAIFSPEGEFLAQKVYEDAYPYAWGLATNSNTQSVVWSNSFEETCTLDGFKYSTDGVGSFTHVYKPHSAGVLISAQWIVIIAAALLIGNL